MKSVYVGNLPYVTTDEELKKLFGQYGTVYGARIKTDRETGRPLGYGFVQMEDADAAKAIEALDGKEMDGRNLRVNETREKPAGDRPQHREFGDRSHRREFGDRQHHREFGDRQHGDRPPRREFGDRQHHHEFGDRPPRREFVKNDIPDPRFGGSSFTPHHADDYDSDSDDADFTPREDFDNGSEMRARRRNFTKKSSRRDFHRDFQDGDRPRRPFFKSSPRKKGFRPNEDYESEED